MGKTKKVFEGHGRLGRDHWSGSPFFGAAPKMHDFGWMVLESLGERDVDKIHKLTCGIVKMETKSVTGDKYLAEKCVKYRIEISVEAELVDDREAE